jgi:4-amino-4-deoxy-L-arabinose transferase-like glycosyltransferase
VPGTPSNRPPSAPLAAAILLAAFAAGLCFYGLGANDINELDEAWHAQVVLETSQSGGWWHPTLFGRPHFVKPALPMWLMAVGYGVLGVTPFATRMWGAFFAVAAVVATYLLGVRAGGIRVGFFAGVALATSYIFVYTHCGRSGTFDSLMVFTFVTATLLFLRATETGRGWVLCAAVAALASHAKNLAGAVPAAVLLAALVIGRPRHRPGAGRLALCALVFVVVNLIWVVPMTMIHGRHFLNDYVGNQVLQRPYGPRAKTILGASISYSWILLAGFFPWTLPALAGLVEEARKALRTRDTASVVILLWLACLAMLLILVLRRVNAWYIIPLLPFLAVSGSRFVLGGDARPDWALCWRAVACFIALLVTVSVELQPRPYPFVLQSIAPLHLVWSGPLRGGLLIALAAAALVSSAWLCRLRAPARQRSPVWAVLLVLPVAAGFAVIRPLASVGHHNVYAQAREALIQARGASVGSLIVNFPPRRRLQPSPLLTRYYFSNIDRLAAVYTANRPRQALARARLLPAPVFCVLITRWPVPGLPPGFPGRVIFSGVEPRPTGGASIYVTVVEVESETGPSREPPIGFR